VKKYLKNNGQKLFDFFKKKSVKNQSARYTPDSCVFDIHNEEEKNEIN
jgi:hypothetical protein